MSNVILKAENICFEYKTRVGLFKSFNHKVLNNLSFNIEKGEVVGILGKNGAGKSTLLRILSGVLAPDSGSVSLPPNTTRSLLSLGLGFNNELTGRDNVILSSMFNGYSKKESILIADDIRDFSELGDFFEQPVRTYSSGMRSRLGFSAGLITKVDILMIDEVLAVGDKHFKAKAEKAMLEKISSDQTVLFVSHNEKQIKQICSRTIDLSNNGEVRYNNKPTKLIDKLSLSLPSDVVRAIVMQDYNNLEKLVKNDFRMLRDVAVLIEDKNKKLALKLMKMALNLNPNGGYMKKKLQYYTSNSEDNV